MYIGIEIQIVNNSYDKNCDEKEDKDFLSVQSTSKQNFNLEGNF